jgi:hypothetical protein
MNKLRYLFLAFFAVTASLGIENAHAVLRSFTLGDDLLRQHTPLTLQDGNLSATLVGSKDPAAFEVTEPPFQEPSNLLETLKPDESLHISFSGPVTSFQTVFFTGLFKFQGEDLPTPLVFTALSGGTGGTVVAQQILAGDPMPVGQPPQFAEGAARLSDGAFDTIVITPHVLVPENGGFGIIGFTVDAVVPEPASLVTFGIGLASLIAACRFRRSPPD